VKLFVLFGKRDNMSKIGRKPINIDGVQVEIKGHDVHYKGPKSSGVYSLSPQLKGELKGKNLYITAAAGELSRGNTRDVYSTWGLERALLANKIGGAVQEFEKVIEIVGLGYKAVLEKSKIVFTLGYSHKVELNIPAGITVEVDKSGQKIKIKASDKVLLGQFCSEIKALRPPEPYKGKGIKLQTEVIFRKAAGKGKK
jgi:large subunit ribosomal protein L6